MAGASCLSNHPRSAVDIRCLHVIDIENLAGGTRAMPSAMHLLVAEYDLVSERGPRDHVIIASSHLGAQSSWLTTWPSARRLVRSGPDGADLELLRVLDEERPEERYGRVIIASGDGIFANAVARIQAAGCNVTVVSRPQALSRLLRLAAGEIRLLDPYPVALTPSQRRPAA